MNAKRPTGVLKNGRKLNDWRKQLKLEITRGVVTDGLRAIL